MMQIDAIHSSVFKNSELTLTSSKRKNHNIKYWRNKRKICKGVVLSDRVMEWDPRPHLLVQILGVNKIGLLDSGATDSFQERIQSNS